MDRTSAYEAEDESSTLSRCILNKGLIMSYKKIPPVHVLHCAGTLPEPKEIDFLLLKNRVKAPVNFKYFRDGNLWYETYDLWEFPI